MFKTGYIQIYTGNGKGKTTASLGVALRILGAGGKVFYAQFIKGKNLSSEFKILNQFEEKFSYHSFGLGRFIKDTPAKDDIKIAREGLKKSKEALQSGAYNLVVLDELNGALGCNLFSLNDVLNIIKVRNSQTELIITGRNAPQQLIDIADLVTEMKEIKHYYINNVPARVGIEKSPFIFQYRL